MPDRFTYTKNEFDRRKGVRLGTLWYSKELEEGDVTLSEYFDSMPDESKLDVLNDIIGLLEKEREYIHDKLYSRQVKTG